MLRDFGGETVGGYAVCVCGGVCARAHLQVMIINQKNK